MPTIDPLLLEMTRNGASDLHLQVGQPPKYRINGEIVAVEAPALSVKMAQELMLEILNEKQRAQSLSDCDFDFSYGIGDVARFRCNYFVQRTGLSAAFRMIPTRIATME